MSFYVPSEALSKFAQRVGAISGSALLLAGCLVTTYDPPGTAPVVPLEVPVFDSDPATESESVGPAASDEPTTITASHLLVQYKGSMHASASVTRSKAEARSRAEEALARARGGEPFAALVAEYSDEPGAAEREGKLGSFSREAMVEEFSSAAFALEVGQYSDIVESPFGFHVILREM